MAIALPYVITKADHLIRIYRFFLIDMWSTFGAQPIAPRRVSEKEHDMTIRLNRRHFVVASWMTAAASSRMAFAQSFDANSLRVLVGYPPGGAVDSVARKLAEKLATHSTRRVSVENKPGAAGRLVVDDLVRAPGNGSTVLITPSSVLTLYPHVYRQLSYDPFTDMIPVSSVCASGFALAVGTRLPDEVNSIEPFVRWCKLQPAAAQCGTAGAGSMPHLLAVLMARESGIDLHHVPYRGGAAAVQAAAGGEVAVVLATEAAARPLVQAGKLRVLATTGSERSPFFPDVATVREQGYPTITQREWFGVMAPAHTPASLVEALANDLRAVLQDADLRETWERMALLPDSSAPAQLRDAMQREHAFWRQLVKTTGFTPEA